MQSESDRPVVRIAAAVIRDDGGRFLLVRKRGTSAFMQAGGKIEAGEQPFAALRRELAEELDLAVEEGQARYLGRFAAEAANEPGHIVEADLFDLPPCGPVTPGAEIEEVIWLVPSAPDLPPLAPLTRRHVLRLDDPPPR
jgi:8-oxo-dGTP pyrophosphatase MutT (NUDIX family)